MNKEVIVYTENPEIEMWQRLFQFTYKSQILKFFDEKKIIISDNKDDICETISNSLSQAKEYFELSENASLNVAPLLIYYGTINLVLGVTTLKYGEKLIVNDHGMKPVISKTENIIIGNQKIHFVNPETGGINVFLKKLEAGITLPGLDDWTLKELLLSIPEINQEAVNCYGHETNYCYALNQTVVENGIATKIFFENRDQERIIRSLRTIPNFDKSYLYPQIIEKDDTTYAILNRKYLSDDISITASYGQKFLIGGHLKGSNNIVLPQWANMYIVLFGLSSLCRYFPDVWNPFIKSDSSGEKLLIEKFLNVSRRILPNIMLSILLDKTIVFENKRYQMANTTKTLTEHEIKELIQMELSKKKGVD